MGVAPEHCARALRCNTAGLFQICFLRTCYQVKLHYYTLHFINGHLISTDFNGNVYMREDLACLASSL